MSVEDAAHEYNESDDGPDGLDFGIDPVQIWRIKHTEIEKNYQNEDGALERSQVDCDWRCYQRSTKLSFSAALLKYFIF